MEQIMRIIEAPGFATTPDWLPPVPPPSVDEDLPVDTADTVRYYLRATRPRLIARLTDE